MKVIRRSRTSSGKEKRWRQREDERVEKLRLLVSYLRNGSSQQTLVNPVKLEADEIELAQRYKSMPILCDNCLKSAELQQPIAMDPMPYSHQHHHQPAGSLSSCSIMNLSGVCGGGGGGGASSSSSCGLYHHSGCGSHYSSCSRTPEIGWNQSMMSGCSSHKQLNASQSSVGIVINVRRSSEQSECLASNSDTDSHHNQQLTSTHSAESDRISGSTYSGIGSGGSCDGSITNLQHVASTNLNASMDSGAIFHNCSGTGLASSTPISTAASSSNGPNYNNNNNNNNLPTGTISATATPTSSAPPSSNKMFYIGDYERRDGCTWTNPPNLASWIDNEVNSLVNDLEASSQRVRNQ